VSENENDSLKEKEKEKEKKIMARESERKILRKRSPNFDMCACVCGCVRGHAFKKCIHILDVKILPRCIEGRRGGWVGLLSGSHDGSEIPYLRMQSHQELWSCS